MINNVDLSHCVSGLKVNVQSNYNSQTNAAGNTVVDYINQKRTIDVTFIPLSQIDMLRIQSALQAFSFKVTYLHPNEQLQEISCILPTGSIEYYTIQDNKVMFKPFTLTFIEL